MGLDLSFTQTGVCVWDGVEALPYSVQSKKGDPYIERAQQIRTGIWELIRLYRPKVICIENPLTHAPRAEMLTGLFYLALDRLLYYLNTSEVGQGVVLLMNPSMRMLMGIKQGRGSKQEMTKTEFKKMIVDRAMKTSGYKARRMNHDEADAFHLAYYCHRFWTDWRNLPGRVDLSEKEREVWYSEESVQKAKKKKKTSKKTAKKSPFKKKGVIYRQDELLFLPKKGGECSPRTSGA